MSDLREEFREYMRESGRRGGRSRSPRKVRAARRNAVKARAALKLWREQKGQA